MTLADGNRRSLQPIHVGEHLVYVEVDPDAAVDGPWPESEIGARRPDVDRLLEGVTAFAQAVGDRLTAADVARLSVEFGCEFALESGKLITVVGKASGKSTLKVTLEWSRPPQ